MSEKKNDLVLRILFIVLAALAGFGGGYLCTNDVCLCKEKPAALIDVDPKCPDCRARIPAECGPTCKCGENCGCIERFRKGEKDCGCFADADKCSCCPECGRRCKPKEEIK